jgi:hypothetical protein
MKALKDFITEGQISFSEVGKALEPYVKTFIKPADPSDEDEEGTRVKKIEDAVVTVGDMFYGKDEFAEFQLKNGRFGQITRQITPGTGTAYRKRVSGFTVGINVSNRWSEFNFDSFTDPNFKKCIDFISNLK